jgi:beta-lactamase superfamily II metal-dependent hydrolase
MAWQLTIYTLDVGQGDSSLIIAEDVPGGLHRTMLIDGGKSEFSAAVDEAVATVLGLRGYNLDYILVTHYDTDHYGGIVGLLNADNMRRVCEVVRDAVVTAATNPLRTTRPQRVACGALAVAATLFGAYGAQAGQIATMCNNMVPNVGAWTDTRAAEYGYQWADWYTNPNGQNPLRVGKTAREKELTYKAAVAAANAIQLHMAVPQAVFTAVFAFISTTLPDNLRFDTGGRYRNVRMMDTGLRFQPDVYTNAVDGIYGTLQCLKMIAPGIDRPTTTPALGAEFLWNSGVAPINAPNNSPAMFCMARRGYVWQGINNPPLLIGNSDTNQMSIASVIRFGNFYFYTGGDLTKAFEKPIATAIRNNPLPNPQNPLLPFPAPPRIAAFKCGHHGSTHSTSQNFLDTMNAVPTVISCGKAQFGEENHPSSVITARLQAHGSINKYYLTNCSYATTGVPASNGQDQLRVGGNKSRVAGQNDLANLNALRHRGDIELFLTRDQSVGNLVPQQFRISYYDDDKNIFGVTVGQLTNLLNF